MTIPDLSAPIETKSMTEDDVQEIKSIIGKLICGEICGAGIYLQCSMWDVFIPTEVLAKSIIFYVPVE
jgi:hypothetical protein